jgi:hypothetical protein
VFYLVKDCILRTKFEREFETLFYKVLSLFKGFIFKPYLALCKQTPFVKIRKPFENLVPILKTSFLAVLNYCIDFRKFLKVV